MITLKIKYFAIVLLASLGLMFTFSSALAVQHCDNPANNQAAIQCGTENVSGNTKNPDEATTSINKTIQTFINILSAIVGIIAVVMIIVAASRYITSGGEASKVASAKNALIYAIIGIAIAALAQIIAKFVFTQTTK